MMLLLLPLQPRFVLRLFHTLPLLLSALALVHCQRTDPPVQLELLTPREQLIRLSMDLRGQHPSESELNSIENHPDLYNAFIDRYLNSPQFLNRMMEIFNLAFLTRTGETYFDPTEAGFDDLDENALAKAIGDEPLQLIRHIIEYDLPYSEVVTASYTMTDEMLASWWGIDYPSDASGWVPATYADARPHAGILSQSTFWNRYPSMGGNANRHRANAISRILLCDDFLTRPIVLDRLAIDMLTQDPENAIRTSDTCQSCHSSLDPLAGNLFGFFRDMRDDETFEEARIYRPENEQAWKEYSGRSPGYFGRPTAHLEELGQAIAEDPRFTDCATRAVFEGLTQRQVTADDWTEFQKYRETFEGSNQSIKALVRAIVQDNRYKTGRVVGDDRLAERLTTVKVASPLQLAQVIEDATGYRWRFDGQDALADNALGLAVLAGGVDSRTILQPAADPTLGLVLVNERLAQSAAYAVVSHDFVEENRDTIRLLTWVNPYSKPESESDAFMLQIEDLYRAITGIPLPPDAEEPRQLIELWSNVYSVSASTTTAWSAVVSAVLRDPNVIFY